jgi:hypothetical protein
MEMEIVALLYACEFVWAVAQQACAVARWLSGISW